MTDHPTPAELLHRDGVTEDEAALVPPGAQLQPIPLRWGLNDVMWGDDDSVTVMLSGPDGEPYWLELEQGRAAVLREDLAGPPADQAAVREQLLAAIDDTRCEPLGYAGKEALLAAYDASRTPADQGADEVDADTVANRAAQVITAMGADVRELKHSRDRYRAAWRNARRRAAVLSAEITRRAPLLGEYAAQIANLRTMYDASEARVSDLIDERDQLLETRTDRAAVLREAADQYAKLTDQNEAYDREHGELDEEARLRHEVVRDVVTGLRRMADETAATETDEQRADREETERDHARGDHTHCGLTCETEMPTEHLRNFVIAKGYPGTKGALDELLRRARAEAAAVLPAPADQAAVRDALHRADEAEARATAMERGMESTAADALKHRGCHSKLMAQCQRAERAEAEVEQLRADRAAVLCVEANRIDATRAQFPIAVQNGITWATAELRRHAAECPECGTTAACNDGPCPLRRRADETAATDTGCWCGHAEHRHWTDAPSMTFPNGCHDCRGWDGAHVYGQDLPWVPEQLAAGAHQPGLRERHRAAWAALTPEQQAARLAELDADDGAQP
ncbi:hypothetical protein [Streptomyces sp. NPDC000351]|uniref:hypothetical protein n=1 Tax=Streptomyces sp. NPDC000351 TaxID=3154250 RepID=UPI003324666D